MPLFKENNVLPAWCELEYYEILRLGSGESVKLPRKGNKEKLLIGEGSCEVNFGNESHTAVKGVQFNIVNDNDFFEISDTGEGTVIIRLCGTWGEEMGGSGLFEVNVLTADQIGNAGDPTEFKRNTNLDNHYHDCDEYYIVYEGRGIVVSEDKRYETTAGDCIATGKGHHHDVPFVYETLKAVYFETTMQGHKRRGHLWNHTHGLAEPEIDRV